VSHYLLLLHALVESLSQIALERHFLAFDGDHPFWSQFDPSEQLAIVSSLADLGFHLDPMEGWLDGRRPTASELVMSLAYAGRDPRALRRMPAPEEIEDLPRSVHVVTLQLLARSAPDLTLDELLDLMGQRGESFGQLWDDWGRIRPVLLSEVGALAA
jgi:hypothetical protein